MKQKTQTIDLSSSSDQEEEDIPSEDYDSDQELQPKPRSAKFEIPDTLQSIFSKKGDKQEQSTVFKKKKSDSTQVNSLNIQDEALKKAELIYKQMNIFNKIPVTAKQIAPLNNAKLEKKERERVKEQSAGKKWGYMPKQELTEELKADLRAIQLRNFIYPNRFYKSNDSKKLPKYFQIGTVVADKNEPRDQRWTKKEQKGSIAEQFMRDDNEKMFSKKKYENINDRLRRMGAKKKQLQFNKNKHRQANKFKGKDGKTKKEGKK